ncbi:MAG: hypothetical protein PHQ98_00670 [Candidatus ainarchaeum sp.]|nr:hypothetical protein [Candidatus ainarchaeum sp.]
MNTIEFMFVLLGLIIGISIISSSLIKINTGFEFKNNELISKNESVFCMNLIDSIYSNSANEYIDKISCFGEENIVFNKEKFSQIIPKIIKSNQLEVEKSEHYIK